MDDIYLNSKLAKLASPAINFRHSYEKEKPQLAGALTSVSDQSPGDHLDQFLVGIPEFPKSKRNGNETSVDVGNRVFQKRGKRKRRQIFCRCSYTLPRPYGPAEHEEEDTKCVNKSTAPAKNLVPNEDELFVVEIFRPFERTQTNEKKQSQCLAEIIFRGDQTLDNLCNMMQCTEENEELAFDLSCFKDRPSGLVTMREVFKSRMLCIGNSFYVDFSEGCKDYSVAVKEWAKSKNLVVGETFDMRKKTFLDLNARFRYPYVYQHLGKCEHIFIIKNTKFVDSDDCLDSSQYPLISFHVHSKYRKMLCLLCRKDITKWLVTDGDRLWHDAYSMCERCYFSYNFVGDKKLGTFKSRHFYGIIADGENNSKTSEKNDTHEGASASL